jgi:transcriptional regulator with XRE-family HTH domain
MSQVSVGFGRTVHRLRTNAGHSQERFAQIVGLDRTYGSRIERGLANVTLEVLDRIAKALDVGLAELLSEAEKEIRAGKRRT